MTEGLVFDLWCQNTRVPRSQHVELIANDRISRYNVSVWETDGRTDEHEMAPLLVPLNDPEGHLCCLKPF